MADLGPTTAGEVGGMFAGAVAVLGLVGAGVKWVFDWQDSRAITRTAKLNAWHAELEAREKKLDDQQADYQARIEHRLALVEKENRALRRAFELVTAALRQKDPRNGALVSAEQLLDSTVPPIFASEARGDLRNEVQSEISATVLIETAKGNRK